MKVPNDREIQPPADIQIAEMWLKASPFVWFTMQKPRVCLATVNPWSSEPQADMEDAQQIEARILTWLRRNDVVIDDCISPARLVRIRRLAEMLHVDGERRRSGKA